MPRKIASIRDEFEKRYVPCAMTSCFLWSGPLSKPEGTSSHIYGLIQKKLAHRVSYELHCGPIPDGLQVCHSCDVPLCVNPDHLFLGTHADNMADKIAKKRQAKGVNTRHARLDDNAIRAIRAFSGPHGIAAERFGVSISTISRVRLGDAWEHVEKTPGYTRHTLKGSANRRSKLTEAVIPTIRARVAQGDRIRSVAADYGVSGTLISMVVRGEIWTHV